MSKHLQRDLENLKKDVLLMGGMVEESVRKAVVALQDRKAELAQEVIDGDDKIDRWEVKVEDECLKLFALYQPVAEDLRFVAAILKINNDLERVGDLSVNIARRAKELAGMPPTSIPKGLKAMSEAVMRMIRESLDAFVNHDARCARKISAEDPEVDRHHREVLEELRAVMKAKPEMVDRALQLFGVSQNLERIGDHATNIAEDVVYMVEGEIVRHRPDLR